MIGAIVKEERIFYSHESHFSFLEPAITLWLLLVIDTKDIIVNQIHLYIIGE
jgi:hypothetical protein